MYFLKLAVFLLYLVFPNRILVRIDIAVYVCIGCTLGVCAQESVPLSTMLHMYQTARERYGAQGAVSACISSGVR